MESPGGGGRGGEGRGAEMDPLVTLLGSWGLQVVGPYANQVKSTSVGQERVRRILVVDDRFLWGRITKTRMCIEYRVCSRTC